MLGTYSPSCLTTLVSKTVRSGRQTTLLATYLGHVNLSGTQHYLHLTAELFPRLRRERMRPLATSFRGGSNHEPTDFSVHVTSFLTHYLAAQRNVSPNTIKAYRDVFTLLLRFCRDVQGIAPEKLRLEQIDVRSSKHPGLPGARTKVLTPDTKIIALQPCTHSFDMQRKSRLVCCSVKKSWRSRCGDMLGQLSPTFPKKVGCDLGAARPPHARGSKRCGFASVLYDTGARVQELVDLSAGDVRFDPPAQFAFWARAQNARCAFDGKYGSASTQSPAREPPGSSRTVRQASFPKCAHERLTRSGIRYILHKYVVLARSKCPSLNRTVSPHKLRPQKVCTCCRAESRST